MVNVSSILITQLKNKIMNKNKNIHITFDKNLNKLNSKELLKFYNDVNKNITQINTLQNK